MTTLLDHARLGTLPDRRPRDPDEAEQPEPRCAELGGTCPPYCSRALGGCGCDDDTTGGDFDDAA